MSTLMKNQRVERAGQNSRCDTCVCQLLNELAGTSTSLCSSMKKQQLLIILNGTYQPLSINGMAGGVQPINGMNGTPFTLVHFDPETCCAVFSFTKGMGANAVTQTLVLDCRCICSVVCLGEGNIQPY